MAQTKRNVRRTPVANEIMAGMRELERMLHEGKSPQEMFTVKTIDVPDPAAYRPRQIRELRESLGVSQTVFARMMGVSVILVKSWERGARVPSALARRLMDTIRSDPPAWVATLRKPAA